MEMRAGSAEAGTLQPLVSVIMPVKNEGRHLAEGLAALERQTYPRERIEILLVDGGSTDGTLRIAEDAAGRDPRIRLLGGPGVNCPAGMNLGIAESGGEIVAKVDGHGRVADDFLATAVARLRSDPSIGCVGGQIVPLAGTQVAVANRIARFSVFGVGAGVYTTEKAVHDVATVQCGVYRRDALERAGLFAPEMQFGEDEELNHRLRATGARIVYDPSIRFLYHIRPTFGGLFRQYRNYGRARVQVVRKHADFLRPKHLAPALLVLALVAAVPVAILLPAFAWAGGLVIGGYLVAVFGAAFFLAARADFARPDLVAISLMCLHLGYGIGTWLGLAEALGERVRAAVSR
jgi:succinoglycan biosynthesis protein ExoA